MDRKIEVSDESRVVDAHCERIVLRSDADGMRERGHGHAGRAGWRAARVLHACRPAGGSALRLHRLLSAERVGLRGRHRCSRQSRADLGALARAVLNLVGDPGLAARLGAAAHDRVRTRYLGAVRLTEYGDLLAELEDTG